MMSIDFAKFIAFFSIFLGFWLNFARISKNDMQKREARDRFLTKKGKCDIIIPQNERQMVDDENSGECLFVGRTLSIRRKKQALRGSVALAGSARVDPCVPRGDGGTTCSANSIGMSIGR